MKVRLRQMKKIGIKATLLALALTAAVFTGSFVNNTHKAVGKFYTKIEMTDTKGNKDIYYQFRSNDDTVWWALTATEMGFIPETNTEYTLTYNDNGSTKANKPCDCAPEFECECEVYDDIFITIKECK